MLTTVIIINYLFSMDNFVVKVSESYKTSYEFAKEVLWISTQTRKYQNLNISVFYGFAHVFPSSTFYEQLLRPYSDAKKFQSQTVIKVKLHKTLLYEKVERKILMKLTPTTDQNSKHLE